MVKVSLCMCVSTTVTTPLLCPQRGSEMGHRVARTSRQAEIQPLRPTPGVAARPIHPRCKFPGVGLGLGAGVWQSLQIGGRLTPRERLGSGLPAPGA